MYWSLVRTTRIVEEMSKKVFSTLMVSASFVAIAAFLLAVFNGILAQIVIQFA